MQKINVYPNFGFFKTTIFCRKLAKIKGSIHHNIGLKYANF
jgi:hypothetical protein